MDIDDLELTIRSSNALKNAGITSVEQLVRLDWRELSDIKNAGEKSITEICWACIGLLNGRVTERRVEWEDRRTREDVAKIAKYDEITAIVRLSQ